MYKLLPLLIFLCSITAYSQTASVIAENANLRGTAAMSGIVVTQVTNGSNLEIIKQVGPWFLVQAKDYAGWIHGDTIRINSAESDGSYTSAPLSIPGVVFVSREPNRSPGSVRTDSPPAIAPVTTQTESSVETIAATGEPTGRCNDGTATYATTKQGACSGHGGVSAWFNSSSESPVYTAPSPSYTPSRGTGGPVQVKGYTRKDGTYVAPHTRSAPRRRN